MNKKYNEKNTMKSRGKNVELTLGLGCPEGVRGVKEFNVSVFKHVTDEGYFELILEC